MPEDNKKLWAGTHGEDCHGDGPCKTVVVEQKLPRLGISAIVTRGSEILLGRSKKEPLVGKWIIPGGECTFLEPLPITVTRELLEETGITIKPGAVLFVSEVLDEEHLDHRVIIYVDAEYVKGEPKAGDDLSEVCWVDVRKLGDLQDKGEVSELTIDALHKFSLILKARNMAKKQGMFGPPVVGEKYTN